MDIFKHSLLPGASILLASLGFWALGMRGMMVTIQGEDYMTYAESLGVKDRTLFFQYAMRNALLPQTTQLGLALSTVLSGAILVEVVVAIGLKASDRLSDEASVNSVFGSPGEIGRLFLTDHLLAFEITAIVLLVAAVGGVILGSHAHRASHHLEASR
jgi:ABC-type microcin C transport system permease subunit YejB